MRSDRERLAAKAPERERVTVCTCGALCPSCRAEWLPDIRVVVHENDCPALAASRHRVGCNREATGFCDCPCDPHP